MDVVDVISQFVKLDRNNSGLCPFHNEKSPSFHVTAKRQTYKCFGCGDGGDAIHFLMEHEKMDFMQAIEWLANRYNVTLEYLKEDDSAKQKREEAKDHARVMLDAVQFAYRRYQTNLLNTARDNGPAWNYLLNTRQFKEVTAIVWGFGHAPDEWQFLSSAAINAGHYEAALKTGMVKTNDGKTFDFYRNRLIIPIHNINGHIIGIAGRWIPTGDEEKDKSQAKYFNPQDSLIYQKSKVLFGLYQALTAKAFAKGKDGSSTPAFFVEGYMDVISMHESGFMNTVSGCGTAITLDQVRLTKRYTDHFIVFTDGDTAGMKAALKFIDMCLQENVRTEVIELPEGEDPDSYIKKYSLTTA